MNQGIYGLPPGPPDRGFLTPISYPGRYFTMPGYSSTVSTLSFSSGFGSVYPFVIDRKISINLMGVQITSSNATSTTEIGVYSDGYLGDPYDEGPHRLLFSGVLDSSTAGSKEFMVSPSFEFTPGLWWAGFAVGGATSVMQSHLLPSPLRQTYAAAPGTDATYGYGLSASALPKVFTAARAGNTSGATPRFWWRIA